MTKIIFMFLELLLSLALSQQVQAPLSFKKLVNSHIDAILEKGYATEVKFADISGDVYHGHVIAQRPRGKCYSSMDDLASKVEMVLYHTAEHTDRWRQETKAGVEHVPRSIVGFRDGSIAKAIDLVDYDKLSFRNIYEDFGTVYSDDLMVGKSNLHNGSAETDPRCVRLGKVKQYLDFEFRITPERRVYFKKIDD